ncbi:hypothetical protein COLO4_11639 [Corchorus olitorius]|uniref:Uncharacterized protein n=1 Tax=Corchorus olitorius TaxID=93759 RepID=A0A1R3K3S9_9ROSI|nr:hypothetical protein COLO4_11639 [Corchorus olitorius]
MVTSTSSGDFRRSVFAPSLWDWEAATVSV